MAVKLNHFLDLDLKKTTSTIDQLNFQIETEKIRLSIIQATTLASISQNYQAAAEHYAQLLKSEEAVKSEQFEDKQRAVKRIYFSASLKLWQQVLSLFLDDISYQDEEANTLDFSAFKPKNFLARHQQDEEGDKATNESTQSKSSEDSLKLDLHFNFQKDGSQIISILLAEDHLKAMFFQVDPLHTKVVLDNEWVIRTLKAHADESDLGNSAKIDKLNELGISVRKILTFFKERLGYQVEFGYLGFEQQLNYQLHHKLTEATFDQLFYELTQKQYIMLETSNNVKVLQLKKPDQVQIDDDQVQIELQKSLYEFFIDYPFLIQYLLQTSDKISSIKPIIKTAQD